MRVPELYKRPGWRCFFAGMMFGAIVSWLIFLFTYGTFQEKQVTLLRSQRHHMDSLKEQITLYREDLHKLNEDNKKRSLIQSVDVHLVNREQYKIPEPDTLKFEDQVKEDISEVITKDIESVYKTKELLKRTVENKEYTIREKAYRAKVTELTIYTKLSLEVRISFAE